MQNAFNQVNNQNNFLNNFINAMGPFEAPDENDPVRKPKTTGRNFNFLKRLPPEQQQIAIQQIKLVVLTILQGSNVDQKIDDKIDSLLQEEVSTKTTSKLLIQKAVNQVFKEITDINSGVIPEWADNDAVVKIPSNKKDDNNKRIYIRRAVQNFKQSDLYQALIDMDSNIITSLESAVEAKTKSLKETKKMFVDQGQNQSSSNSVGREYLSNMVKNMLLEFSYGQGYSPYPYHSDIGEEGEEAPDFVQDWKDFELSLVRDESRKTAIKIAKILVKDLELFGDVVDLVGKNQSVATEILKNFKKSK